MTSLIVPVYDGADVLGVTVPATLALDGVDEWIWVDDGSRDGTATVLSRLLAGTDRARVLSLPANRGRSAARNAGLAASRGDLVIFFDADVEPAPGAAVALLAALDPLDSVASVARLAPILTRPDDPYQDYLAHHPRGPRPGLSPGHVLDWRFFLSGACAVRRDALDRIGGFEETIGYGEDVALACRLAARAPAGLRLADTTVRLHDVGHLEEAVGRAAAFGRSLPRLREVCGRGTVSTLARLAPLAWAAGGTARGLYALVRRLGPGQVRRKAVRYLLAATIVRAGRRA